MDFTVGLEGGRDRKRRCVRGEENGCRTRTDWSPGGGLPAAGPQRVLRGLELGALVTFSGPYSRAIRELGGPVGVIKGGRSFCPHEPPVTMPTELAQPKKLQGACWEGRGMGSLGAGLPTGSRVTLFKVQREIHRLCRWRALGSDPDCTPQQPCAARRVIAWKSGRAGTKGALAAKPHARHWHTALAHST